MGMGLQFTDIDPADQKKLDELLTQLAGGTDSEKKPAPVSSEFATAMASMASELRELETLVASHEDEVDPRLLVGVPQRHRPCTRYDGGHRAMG